MLNDIEQQIRYKDVHACVGILKQYACPERKIACIKAIRTKWFLGLKNAKEWVEALIEANTAYEIAVLEQKLQRFIDAAAYRGKMYSVSEDKETKNIAYELTEGAIQDLEGALLGYNPILLDELLERLKTGRAMGHTSFKIILEQKEGVIPLTGPKTKKLDIPERISPSEIPFRWDNIFDS